MARIHVLDWNDAAGSCARQLAVNVDGQKIRAVLKDWVVRLSTIQSVPYTVTESNGIYIVSSDKYAAKRVKWLQKSVQRSLSAIAQTLQGLVPDAKTQMFVILVFHSQQLYRSYIEMCYPRIDVNAVSMTGILVQKGLPHCVFPEQDLLITEGILAHELTRVCLSHRDLPVWLEEGLANFMESELTGHPKILLMGESLEAHRNFWNEYSMQEFWTGSAFYRTDEGSAFSRELSKALVDTLILKSNFDAFKKFVLDAQIDDAGEESAVRHFGVSLGDLVVQILQIDVRKQS